MNRPITKRDLAGGGDTALSIRNVSKVYMSRSGWTVALEDCSLEVPSGGFFVLAGPSGCGKTTLLNVLAGFERLTKGEVCLGNDVIAAPNLALRPGPDRLVVFQHGGLFPWMTVIENICYGPIIQKKMDPKEARERARGMMAGVGLANIENVFPNDLSGGMRRRVEIIRALISRPRILLMDEPFRALDALTKSVMHEFLLRLYDQEPYTIFFITHDLIEAIYLADTVSVMSSRPGRIKSVFEIDLPRPRSHRMLTSDKFIKLKAAVTEAVHEEAIKAFVAGEREMAR
jgi:NitT/TauT family transport system ATP-binding protein